ncbi:hypothetical protein AAHC03_05388 [Spirometra sp. Aus1]
MGCPRCGTFGSAKISNKKRLEADSDADEDADGAEAIDDGVVSASLGATPGLETYHRCVWSSVSIRCLSRRTARTFHVRLHPTVRCLLRSDPDKIVCFYYLNYAFCWFRMRLKCDRVSGRALEAVTVCVFLLNIYN